MADVRRSGSFSLGLLLGGLIGTALALLLAPERGEETRRRVRSRAEPVAERAKDTMTRLARRGERAAEEREETAGADVESDKPGEQPSRQRGEVAKEESPSQEANSGG